MEEAQYLTGVAAQPVRQLVDGIVRFEDFGSTGHVRHLCEGVEEVLAIGLRGMLRK